MTTLGAVPQRAWIEQIMGLPISIHLRGDRLTGEAVEHRIEAVFAELRHVDAVLSPYRAGSDLSAWERGALPLVESRSGAVATSGSAHRGAHIIDPHTRRPATATRAVTVIGPALLWADVHATAAAAQGSAALSRLEDLDGYDALMVTRPGLLRVTAGWPAP